MKFQTWNSQEWIDSTGVSIIHDSSSKMKVKILMAIFLKLLMFPPHRKNRGFSFLCFITSHHILCSFRNPRFNNFGHRTPVNFNRPFMALIFSEDFILQKPRLIWITGTVIVIIILSWITLCCRDFISGLAHFHKQKSELCSKRAKIKPTT